MKGKSLKWLRILHIISAGIWFGATVCIGGLAVICLSNPDAAEFLVTAPLVPELYRKMILPAALFTILQGLVYGFFTEWGFLKHRWVTIKWIFTILLIPCIGAGGIGQMFALIDKVKSSGLKPTREIVITGEPKGENTAAMLKLVQEHYLPDTVTVFKPGSSFLLV